MKKQRVNLLIDSLFFLASIFLSFLVFEYFLSLNSDEKYKKPIRDTTRAIRLREHAQLISRSIVPNRETLKNADSLIYKPYFLKTDDNGYIITRESIQKRGDINLVFLGGSTTECLYVDEELRFPYLTGKLLESNFNNLKVNSFNSGVSGNNSMHSINILLNKILANKPNYIILMHNHNDLTFLLKRGNYWSQTNRSVDGKTLIFEPKQEVQHHDNIVTKTKKIFEYLLPRTYNRLSIFKSKYFKINKKGISDQPIQDIIYNEEDILSQISSSLNSYIKIANSWNVRPVLMTQANRFILNPDKVIRKIYKSNYEPNLQMRYEDYVEIYAKVNDLIRETAKENHVILVDLAKLIPPTAEYFYDQVHFNNTGSSLAAEIITKVIYNDLKVYNYKY